MPSFSHPNLMVGTENYDDAGVYKISDDLALIQTVDFFTPMVDDPFTFGQIAAANALSDIYAMGGEPLTALNIATFPKCSDLEVFGQILRGGAEKVMEAGALLIGGHTVDDKEPKYGLAVTGIAKPEEILSNDKARPGDILIMTKTLGNGIIATGIKAGMIDEEIEREVIRDMATLNKQAGAAMGKAGVHSATDITGFGFLGHLGEMMAASKVSAEVWADRLPIWEKARELAEMGIIPGGCYNNKNYLADRIDFEIDVPRFLQDIMFDPQTSGGLLIAVSPQKVDFLASLLQERQVGFRLVGRIHAGNAGRIHVRRDEDKI
jgi:selenide,water dikinase